MQQPKLILDLCGGTGSWSKPYITSLPSIYEVLLVDPMYPPHLDILDWKAWLPTTTVHGILAAPPCTDFAVSGARWFKDKDTNGQTQHSLDIVDAVLDIIDYCHPTWWALENPTGRLLSMRPQLGEPILIFNPYEYGDYYTKRTLLWGQFNKPLTIRERIDSMPTTTPQELIAKLELGLDHASKYRVMRELPSYIHHLGSKHQVERSITPPNFAQAFYEANS